jgi:uncharacterized protein (TIGR03000 family)
MTFRTPRCCVALLVCAVVTAPASAADRPPANQALLLVRLPADAQLTIGVSSTEQRGAERLFISPALPDKRQYAYQLTAIWNVGAQRKTLIREVVVRAGQQSVADFLMPETAQRGSDALTLAADTPMAPVATKPAVSAKNVDSAPAPSKLRARSFLFTYGATVTGLEAGQTARVWLPVPSANEDQDVAIESKELPATGKINRDAQYGNQILYVEGKAGADGTIPVKVVYRVTRREVQGTANPSKEGADQIARFLQADAKVPVGGKAMTLIQGKRLPKDSLAAAHELYDVVNKHMRYSKDGAGWGQGDSDWACDSKYGNCSDFHSLFISLARAEKIPAKFEIGFPLPEKRGQGEIPGYHCWAKFFLEGKGWIPVDISEANKNPKLTDYYFGNLNEDRVAFSTGRDLELAPKQEGDKLNFFIYPYVEVGGKPYPAEKIQKKFAFQDVSAK